MLDQFSRTQLIFGKDAMEVLKNSHVCVFGIGGVGGYVCEALARSGVGKFTLIDNDTVSLTNINRQIIATMDTIGKYKVDVMKERILSINPKAIVETYKCFYLPSNANQFDFTKYDYVIDAIDTITAKIDIILKAQEVNTKIISSMGAGNKTDPMSFKITDIYKTEMDPLAKVMRHELKKRNVKKLKVIYSTEKSLKPLNDEENYEELKSGKRETPGSNAFVPSACGLLIASEVVKDLTNDVARSELKR